MSRDGGKKSGFLGSMFKIVILASLVAAVYLGYEYYEKMREAQVLRAMISRLTGEERVAEVWVKEYKRDSAGRPERVTLKILEKNADGNPLAPVLCTFSLSDIIHFEALVIRLTDKLVMEGDGKSIYLFRRAFALQEGGNTYESCDINEPMEVPEGYALGDTDRYVSQVEQKYWRLFWTYALDANSREAAGVKNAQIEAPATRFVSNVIYRIILEHDGGLRIEATPIPDILKDELGK